MTNVYSRYVIARRTESGEYVIDDRFDEFSLLPCHVKEYNIRLDPLLLYTKDGRECVPVSFHDSSYRFERFIDKQWKQREYVRLQDGTYDSLPSSWLELTWPDATALHYPHISIESDICVAFTSDAAKGERDIQTRMRPGRYLTRFIPGLDSDKVRELACEIDKAGDFKLAVTRQEIRRVYREGPSSCMSHSLDNYSSQVHPVEVYAAGDLAVAYLGAIGERISARVLCWPDKKVYSLIYGDSHRLEASLHLAGYKRGSLEGARLLRIPYEDDPDIFVMPYIDSHGHFTEHEDSKHFAISNGGKLAVYTHGLSAELEPDEDEDEYCHGCDDYCGGDLTYVQNVGQCCESYVRNNCYQCAGNGRYYCEDINPSTITEDTGETYSPGFRHRLFEHDGLYYGHRENMPEDEDQEKMNLADGSAS